MCIRDSEYVYVWTSTKWFVGSYTLEVEGVGRYAEYNSTWNGWEELVTVYIREGNETVTRYRKMVSEGKVGDEYLDYASELEEVVSRYHRAAMKGIVRDALAA